MSIQSMIITFLEQSTLDACQINHEINNQIDNTHITETKSKFSETFATKYVCIKQFDWGLTTYTPHHDSPPPAFSQMPNTH